MTKQTEFQRANTEILQWRFASVPEGNVMPRLCEWQASRRIHHNPTSRTVACIGAWVALMPEFVELGVRQRVCGSPSINDGDSGSDVAKYLFGDPDLFDPARCHPADKGFVGTDHALVMNRIERLLS